MAVLEEELRELIRTNFGSVPKFAEAIEEPSTSIYGALSRGMKNTRTELTDKIYRGLGVDMNSVSLSGFKGLKLLSPTSCDFVDVPLYGSIAAGTPIEMIEVDGTHPVPSKVCDRYPNAFLLKVEGDSMNRVLPDGCYALVDPCETVEDNGKPYAVCVNGYDATIKRVRKLNSWCRTPPTPPTPRRRTTTTSRALRPSPL